MRGDCGGTRPQQNPADRRKSLARPGIAWLVGIFATLIGCSGNRNPAPPIILVSLDTLRWDHVGAMTGDSGVTPNLDKLAADGVSFRTAIAQAPWTLPSHASVFTGQYPSRHGVTVSGLALDEDRSRHIATLLTDADFASGAFVNEGFWRHDAGLDHGFQSTQTTPTARFPDEIGEWLSRHQGSPFFLFVHNFGVTAFDAPKISPPHLGSFGYDLAAFLRHYHDTEIPEDIEADLMPRVRSRYRLAVSNIDLQLGRLIGWLRNLGLYDECALIVFSDHGTELGEHGRTYHGHSLYDELIRVPLIIKLPGNSHAGAVVDRPVRLMDIYPTITGIAGIQLKDREIDGVDLRPLMDDPDRPHPPAGTEVYGTYTQFSIRTEHEKVTFVESPEFPGIINSRHFDLVADPGEHAPIPGPGTNADWEATVERVMGRPATENTIYGADDTGESPVNPPAPGIDTN